MKAATVESLQANGFSFKKIHVNKSSTINLEGIPISLDSFEGEKYEWSTSQTSAQASFTKESYGKSIIKFFKKGLEIGDEFFDNMVYISTNDKDSTWRFLEEISVRDHIADVVSQGGSIIVEKEKIQVLEEGKLNDEALNNMAQFVSYATTI